MKNLVKILAGFLILACLYALVCLGLILSQINARPATMQGYQTILVLGARIELNKQPAVVTKERLDAALRAAKDNPQARIVVSGAQAANEPEPEAQGMAAYLEKQGIAPARIVEEKRARNTYENLKYSKPLVKGEILLVTSDFHVYRSLLLARRLDYREVKAYAARTDFQSPLYITGYYGREIFSLGRTLIFGK